MTHLGTDQVVGAVRRTTLSRGAARLWQMWKDAGLPLLAAYWIGVGAVVIYGLWEGYQRPDLGLPAWAMAVAVALLWTLAVRVRRQPLWIHITDEVLLQAPLATTGVLLWPLLRALLTPLAWGVGLGTLVGLLLPQLRWLAVSLPLCLMGAAVLQAWSTAARPAGDPQTRTRLHLLALLPLLAAPSAPLLPLVTGAGLMGALLGWSRQWGLGVNARSRLDLQYEGVRRGAQRLGLPASVQHPDVPPRHFPVRPPLRGRSAAAACTWRSQLHVLAHLWRLVPALAMGPALLPLFSTAAEPVPGGPMWSGIVLALVLPLLGPAAPAGVPISVASQRLARVWPAALPLSLLSIVSGVLTVLWGNGPVLLLLAAALAPWVALANAEWLETSGLLPPDQAAQVRFGVALLPGIVTFLCLHFGLPWAMPLLLLAGAGLPLIRR